MLKYTVVSCILLWNAEITIGCGVPRYNFSISRLHNQIGHWYAENIKLDHEGNSPWNVIINTTSEGSKCSQSILIISNREQASTSDLKILPTEKRNPPGPGYELITGLGYYKVHTEPKSWNEAKKICEQEGANLYVFELKKEADAVNALLEKSGKSKTAYWIGVHDKFKEGNYITIFNETFYKSEYFLWRPDGNEIENCGCIDFTSTAYGFCDFRCTHALIFICKRKLEM